MTKGGRRIGVKRAAEMMQVSERMVRMAQRLMRSGRADLIESVERGRRGLPEALAEAEGRAPSHPDLLAPLVEAA